jgi:lipopolysaccharide assembly outer membrane protein LptD (OstA)
MLFIVLFAYCLFPTRLLSQDSTATPLDATSFDIISDSTQDEILIDAKSDLEQQVIYSAKDSAVFIPSKNLLRLRGDAKVDYGKDKLGAEVIIFDMEKSNLEAKAMQDSSGNYYGFPKYNQQENEYYAKQLTFNFKTKKGVISAGETELSEGFYFGEKIKRINDREIFIQNGFYTTCEAPHPHYYFGSPEMKIVSKEKVFLDPLIFYVEDIPVFIYPFGIFFPNKSGRQSGLIVPSFAFSSGRGVIFDDLGFYWAASDYWDMQFTTDFYSKGGYLLGTSGRWNVKDRFSGNASLEYGYTRFNTDEDYVKAWKFTLNHKQNLTPYQNISANLNFSSADFNRNTKANINDRITQSITSNASYSIAFDNGSNISMAYNREQNIITDEHTQSIPLTYSIPNLTLFKLFGKDVTFRNSSRLNYTQTKRLDIDTGEDLPDTTFQNEERKYLSHSPSISFSLPRIFHFNIVPSLNFGVNNYFRKMTKSYDTTTNEVQRDFETGFFTEYYYSYGVSAQTRLYGIMNFGDKGLKAIRHTFEPTISYRINPDFSDNSYDFYGTYYDKNLQREITYSKFEADGGSHASSNLQQNIGINLVNRFEAKVSSDSTDKNLELLQLNLNANYNMAADSLNWSDISASFRTPAVSFISFSGNANFTLYDEANIFNEDNEIVGVEKINKFLFENNKGIVRLTNLNLSLSTSFDSEGIKVADSFGQDAEQTDTTKKESSLGERFSRRMNLNQDERDLFGECNPGYQPLSIPWSMNLGLNYRYSEPFAGRIDRSVNLNLGLRLQLTETWKFDANCLYDLIDQTFENTSVNITKDMHCWDLSVRWYPTGVNRGFYLRFGIKASQLQDLKLEKRDDPIYR